MSEEEKELIKEFKEEVNKDLKDIENVNDTFLMVTMHNIEIIVNLIEKQEKVLNNIKQEVFNFNESLKLYDTLTNDNFRIAYVIIKKIENYLKEIK